MRHLIFVFLVTFLFIPFKISIAEEFAPRAGNPVPVEITGEWNAEITILHPTGTVYITRPRVDLDKPFYGQRSFSLGLDGTGGEFICKHFGYGRQLGHGPAGGESYTGKISTPYYLLATPNGKDVFALDLSLTDSGSDAYYLTVVCENH